MYSAGFQTQGSFIIYNNKIIGQGNGTRNTWDGGGYKNINFIQTISELCTPQGLFILRFTDFVEILKGMVENMLRQDKGIGQIDIVLWKLSFLITHKAKLIALNTKKRFVNLTKVSHSKGLNLDNKNIIYLHPSSVYFSSKMLLTRILSSWILQS